MTVQINYKKTSSKNTARNVVLFTGQNFDIKGIKKYVSNVEYSHISDLLKTSDLKKDLLIFEISSKKKIVLISIKSNLKNSEIERLGAKFYKNINYGKNCEYLIYTDTITIKQNNFVGFFLHGVKLKSYQFLKYKSKKDTRVILLNILGKNKPTSQNQLKFKSLEEGTFFARDLVSEPGNILHPDEYAKRINSLKKVGLKVNIYDEKKLKKAWNEYFTWCRPRKY